MIPELSEVCDRNSWDSLAVEAVVSLETGGSMSPDAGIDRWSPKRTAVGLLQWTEGTLRQLDVPTTDEAPRDHLRKYGGRWRSWNCAGFRFDDQCRLLERFYIRAFEKRGPKRPVDYYLAPWGAAPGLGLGTVLSVKGDGVYEQNRSLDVDGDGKIQVKDLARLVRSRMAEIRAHAPPKSAAIVPASALTLGGVLTTVGFKVIQRRMMLGL
jgi:hypothetical protein